MYIDVFTVLLFALLVKIVLAALFFFFWSRSHRAHWFAWWGTTFLLGSLAAVFFLRGVEGAFFQVGLGTLCLAAGFACAWQGARSFEKRPIVWWPIVAGPGLWFVACLMPGFLQNIPLRICLSSTLFVAFLGLTAFEFWRGRKEKLASRWAIVGLFSSLALIFGIRIPLIPLAPFPFGALPQDPTWVGVFNILLFFHTITLAVLLVALPKERLELEQRKRAQTDPLTGAFNRRALMSKGRRLLLRHERNRRPLSLLFLDLDNFKRLNDRLGHSGGDEALIRFVALINDNIRPDDFLFRMGGEEFCCLLPQTRAGQAVLVAERIRQKLEGETFDIDGMPIRTTVSIGVASTGTSLYDLDSLLRLADRAVYRAKRQGRNQVVIADMDEAADSMGLPSERRPPVAAA